MRALELEIQTQGERFYSITEQVQAGLAQLLEQSRQHSGVLHVFTMHTSCALCLNESYDPAAARDMEAFLKHLAPRNLPFITHVDEGEDDSPSHMKSILLNPTLTLIVEDARLYLGQWQGIYLCEFRDSPKKRKLLLKFSA